MRKLVLFLSCFASFAGLSAQNPQLPPFTLSAFIGAKKAAQVQTLTDLLRDPNFSDADVACLLEIEVANVTRARKYVGPLEVENLLHLIRENYDERCISEFRARVKTILAPLFWGGALFTVYVAFLCGGYLYFENIALKPTLSTLPRQKK